MYVNWKIYYCIGSLKEKKKKFIEYFHKSVHPVPFFYVIYVVRVSLAEKCIFSLICKLFMNKLDILLDKEYIENTLVT